MIVALFVTVGIALTVPGFVLAVRALPWVSRQVDAGIKPWACDVCSCFWSTVLFTMSAVAGTHLNAMYLLCSGPAYTLAMLVLARLEQPTSAPLPPLPPAPDGLAETLEPRT